jgi:hypothetical protein
VPPTEKRKVDSSILSLTTHYHQRISSANCGNAAAEVVSLRSFGDRSRPLEPAEGRCLVHVGCTEGSGHAARPSGCELLGALKVGRVFSQDTRRSRACVRFVPIVHHQRTHHVSCSRSVAVRATWGEQKA